MVLNRAAQSLRGLPNLTAASVPVRNDHYPGPPVCRFESAAASVSTPATSTLAYRHRTG